MAYPDPYKPSDVKRVGNSYSGMNVTGDNITINGKNPGGGFMVADGLAARALAQQDANPGGQVSSHNMNAADGLAARALRQAPAATPDTGAPAGVLTNVANQSLAARALSGSPQPSQMEQPAQGLAARALAQQGSANQRSPVGMTVDQAQQQGLVGESVGYNPAYDQRINQGGMGGGLAARALAQQDASRGGQPSSQNMAAADGLAARAMAESQVRLQQREPGMSLAQAAMQQREPYNPNAGSSAQWMGDLRDPRNLALRNASVGSTIFRNKGEEMMANRARQARIAGVQSMIGGQMQDAQQADTARYQSDNALAGNLGTEQMRQDGANRRSLVQMALEQQKAQQAARHQASQYGLASQRLQLEAARVSQSGLPSGYRYRADGSGLEAIPGGPADVRNGKEAAQQGKDAQDVLSILNQARPLVSASTGSYAGTGVDKAAQVFGLSTPGAESIAQLQALEGSLISKMPKMSGPQSDKDVLLYRQMAGQIGDSKIPAKQRLAAMDAVEALHRKYTPAGAPAAQAQQAGQPQQERPSIDSFWGGQ